MATAAEPRPAELPLPSGRPGATVRLHPLLTGRMRAPRPFLLREGGRFGARRALGFGLKGGDWQDVPVAAFLIEHPGAGMVLVDTGLHPAVAVNPSQNLGRVAMRPFKDVRMDPGQAVSAQLRERGRAATDVKVVVMTHLHADHASAIAEFPQATFVVSKLEWEHAASAGQREGYFKRQFDHGFDYRLVDFDGPDASSFAGFGRSLDLFGDGSVRVVFTPGHTPGHMSVVVRTSGREILLTGDAAYLRRTLDEEHLPHYTADDHLFRRSLKEIRLYMRETPDALVIPGHDWQAWQALQPAY